MPSRNLDRMIDAAVADLLAGESRVTGASVRAAVAAESHRSLRFPGVLALAAIVLLVLGGVALWRSGRPDPHLNVPDSATPRVTAGAGPGPRPTEYATAFKASLAPDSAGGMSSGRARALGNEEIQETVGGVPRLELTRLASPEPLRTRQLETNSLEVARLDLAPLRIQTLSTEQDHP